MPKEGDYGTIAETSGQILGVYDNATRTFVGLMAKDDKQKWLRNKHTSDKYFTLRHSTSKRFLTSSSPTVTTVTSNIYFFWLSFPFYMNLSNL